MNDWPLNNNWKKLGKNTQLADDVGEVSWTRSGAAPCFTDVM